MVEIGCDTVLEDCQRLDVLTFLCQRLIGGCCTSPLPSSGCPTERTEALISVLAALGIPQANDVVKGLAPHSVQLSFLNYLTSLVEEVSQSEQQTQQTQQTRESATQSSHADSQLLSLSCGQASQLLSGDMRLFAATPALQRVASQTDRVTLPDQLKQQLQQAEAELVDIEDTSNMQESVVQQCDPIDLAESLDTFLFAAKGLDLLFHQELEPWTQTTAPTTMQDIGPMSQEAFKNYEGLMHLLTACKDIGAAHEKISEAHCKAMDNSWQSKLNGLLLGTAQQASKLKVQEEMLPLVQQRLLKSAASLPQLADL